MFIVDDLVSDPAKRNATGDPDVVR